MKKRFKFKIASLALCAVSCLALAIATSTFTKATKTAAAATNTEITTMYTLADFKIEEKAAIRKDEPVGIRFTTKVDSDTKTQIVNKLGGDGTKVAFGTLIIPTDFLGGEELTHNTPSVVEGQVSEWLNDTTYTVVLGGKGGANLGESYYNRPISARSFAYNTETGEVCYTSNTANRSIGYVAYMAKAENDTSDLVATIEEKTNKELVFNENVSIHNEESTGTELIVNKYEKQSADVFTLKIGGIVVDATITYSSSNTDVITAENGVVTAVGNGVSTVTGTVTYDGVEYSASKEISTDYYAPSSQFTILVPATATSYEMTAANKLRDMILEATGVGLSIVTESGRETTDGKYISVGDTVLATANCDVSDLEKDTASRVKTVDNSIFVRGATDAATLYGVQRLLKETVGYEYYLDNTYVVSETKEILIADKDYVPAIDEVWQMGGTADMTVAEEHAAVSYVDNLIPIGTTDEEDASNLRYKGAAHNSILFFSEGVDDSSLYSLSSKDYKKWYATNSSNYYLTGKSGLASLTSGAGKQELCYTAHGDSTVRNAMIEKLTTEMFRKMTTIEEFKNYDRVAFSHNDIQSWCECSKCNAEGNPSDNMLHFILDVAASLKTKLSNAGDARAETFKICTLFYNETNLYPTNIANYQSAVDSYMSHVEIWFAETRADYHVSLDTATDWNTTAKSNFDKWTALASNKRADVLWWGYYMNAKSSFIPYDSIDALRANYALAYNAGVDYMFNQAMAFTVNWVRLKQYLTSELRWNAIPDDDTWSGWIENYMQGAFGPGATAMTEYFNAWNSWAETNASNFNNTTGYSGSGIYKLLSEVASTENMSAETLQGWIASCNKAIAALDVNDDNYTTYYNNIVLERMTPLYLIMHLYGFDYEISTNDNPYEAITSYTLKDSAYVLPYAQDFLDAATLWNVSQDGEMSNLDTFKSALTSQLSGITAYEETAKQTVITDTSITLTSANIASGETYTATLINSAGEVAATEVTANDGSVTLIFAEAPAVGACNVVLRSSTKAITFTNVLVVTGTIANYADLKAITGKTLDGYYVLTNDITDATGTITLRAGTFSGILDGNGYTVDSVSVGASGLFKVLSGATIKNINFTNFSATDPAFGTTATNCTFENLTVSFVSGGPTLVTTVTGCTFTNVKVYVNSASATSTPDGVKVIVGADTGKTFYIPEGETEVWLRDENLTIGDYTVDVDGDVSNASVFAAGKMQVTINGLALGDTVKVSCDNGTAAYVYNVMRVAKIVMAESGEELPEYNGDKTALGYYNSDVVQTVTVEDTSTNQNGAWGDGIWSNRVKIFAPGTQDYITVDFVAANDFVGTMFHLWPTTGSGSFSKTGVFSDNGSGATVSIVDEYGFSVNSVVAGRRYTLRVYDPNAAGLAIGVYGANTIYFGNVTYGMGTPAEPITPPNVTLSDGTYPIYKGDETALGYEEETMVFTLENATPDNLYTDGWAKRILIGAPGTQDYITFEFVAKEDVEASNIFHVWGTNGAPSIGSISASTGLGGDWAIILDKHGFGITSIKAGEHYFASIACVGLTQIQVGAIDVNEIYVANITYNNGDLPTAMVETITADSTNTSAVSVYDGDEVALGFAEGTTVYEYVGVDSSTDKAVFSVDSANYDYVEVQLVIASGDGYFFAYALNGGSYLNSGSSYVIDPSNIRLANGNAMDRTIQVFDANGNAVSTLMSTNTLYTLRIYIDGVDQIKLAKTGSTIYLANVTHGNDETVVKPTEVVTDGSGTELPQFTGTNSTIGFANTDYVFEQVTTDSWSHRAHVGNNSTADFLVFDFSINNPSNLTVWFTRNGSVVQGYSNVVTTAGAVVANECAARTIYVFDASGNGVSSISANTKYTMWIYLGGTDSFTGVAIGNSNATIYYANVRYESTGDNIMRQGDANALLPEYTGDVETIGFEEGAFVQTLVGESDAWVESIYANRARITADGTQDYISVDFVLENAISGDYLFYLWAASSNGSVKKDGTSSAFTTLVDENGVAVDSIVAGRKYTFSVYDPGATYLAIGAYCNNTIYFGNITYGTGEPETYALLKNSNGALATYTGDVTTLGFAEGEYVQQMVTEATDSVWEGTRQNLGALVYAPVGQYVSVMFSLNSDFTSSDGYLFFVWGLSSTATNGFSNNNTYVNLTASANARILGTNGEVVTDTLKANTVYMLELYLADSDGYQIANINKMALTVSFATKSVKTYTTSIASSPVTGSIDGAVTVHYGTEALGFDRNEVVQRLETETVSNVWSDTQPTSGKGRASWLIKVAAEAGQKVTIRFALSQDFTSTGMLFFVWAYDVDFATNNKCTTGSIPLSGSSTLGATITDEAGNPVTELKAYQVYELTLYVDAVAKYDIGNMVAEGMITYVSSEVTYEDYVAEA